MARYTAAAPIMVPKAAAAGTSAERRFRNEPNSISRLTSSATTKKKNAISRSFTQCRSDSSRCSGPMLMKVWEFQTAV